VLTGIAQDGPVEPVVVAPALEVLGPAQQFRLADVAGDVGVQHRLERLLEELHADGQGTAPLTQAADDFELVQVILVTVVGLADEDDAFIGELREQAV
jgi:hypothetical protein